MKKVSLIVSVFALVLSASCTKQGFDQPEFDVDDLEVVFEELSEDGTKAAVTQVDLDVNGDVLPSSRTLTATLRYKTSKTPITSGVSWSWDKSFNGVNYDPYAHRPEDRQQKLDAVAKGSGTVSTVATYKGQEVSSPTVDVNVSEYELHSIKVFNYGNISHPSGPYGDEMGLDYALTSYFGTGIVKEFVYAHVHVIGYFWKDGINNYSTNVQKRLTIADGVEYSFPDLDGVTLWTGAVGTHGPNHSTPWTDSEEQRANNETFRIPLKKGINSGTIGDHIIKANYKGESAEMTFTILSDWYNGPQYVYHPDNYIDGRILGDHAFRVQTYPSTHPNYAADSDKGIWYNDYGSVNNLIKCGTTLTIKSSSTDNFTIGPCWPRQEYIPAYNEMAKNGLLNLVIRDNSSYMKQLAPQYTEHYYTNVSNANQPNNWQYYFSGQVPGYGKYTLELYLYNMLTWTLNLVVNP